MTDYLQTGQKIKEKKEENSTNWKRWGQWGCHCTQKFCISVTSANGTKSAVGVTQELEEDEL